MRIGGKHPDNFVDESEISYFERNKNLFPVHFTADGYRSLISVFKLIMMPMGHQFVVIRDGYIRHRGHPAYIHLEVDLSSLFDLRHDIRFLLSEGNLKMLSSLMKGNPRVRLSLENIGGKVFYVFQDLDKNSEEISSVSIEFASCWDSVKNIHMSKDKWDETFKYVDEKIISISFDKIQLEKMRKFNSVFTQSNIHITFLNNSTEFSIHGGIYRELMLPSEPKKKKNPNAKGGRKAKLPNDTELILFNWEADPRYIGENIRIFTKDILISKCWVYFDLFVYTNPDYSNGREMCYALKLVTLLGNISLHKWYFFINRE